MNPITLPQYFQLSFHYCYLISISLCLAQFSRLQAPPGMYFFSNQQISNRWKNLLSLSLSLVRFKRLKAVFGVEYSCGLSQDWTVFFSRALQPHPSALSQLLAPYYAYSPELQWLIFYQLLLLNYDCAFFWTYCADMLSSELTDAMCRHLTSVSLTWLKY